MSPSPPAPEWPLVSSLALGSLVNGEFVPAEVYPISYRSDGAVVRSSILLDNNVIYSAIAVTPPAEFYGESASQASSDDKAEYVSSAGNYVLWYFLTSMSNISGSLNYVMRGTELSVDYAFGQV